jgi:hypothetical protein
MKVINGDQTARDKAQKKQQSAQANYDRKSAGYDKKTASKEEKKAYNEAKRDLKAANKEFATADKAYQHTQQSIDNFKEIDPLGFATLDNLTYKNVAGKERKIDVVVNTGDTGGNGPGATGVKSVDSQGNIDGPIRTTLEATSSITSNVLAHEFGHGMGIAADPINYFNQMKSNPGFNCRDTGSIDTTLGRPAMQMEKRYDYYKANYPLPQLLFYLILNL